MNGLVLLAACVCAVTGQIYTPGLAPLTAPSSQFHAQDEFGQFSFGHAGVSSSRTEARNAYGVTTGGYQYIDANGLLQTVQYVADPINGFRVSGTNLPVAPGAPVVTPLAAPVFDLPLPVAVEDTAEVKAAKAEFEAAYAVAAAAAAAAPEEEAVVEADAEERKKREAEEEKAVLPAALPLPYLLAGHGLLAGAPADIVANIDTAVPTVAGTYAGLPALAGVAPYAGLAGVAPYAGLAGVAPYAGLAGVAPYAGLAGVAPYAALPAAPVAAPLAVAPAVAAAPSREAVKTTIKLNPGHAVFYRVD